ncbi:hypothetical protein [Frondihabitans sucicola]|nr:hypothetical protein [Frondihabitans sucicola]
MKPASLPRSLRHEPFLVADAVPVVGAERLRRRDLGAPTRGLRIPGASADRGALTPFAFSLLLGDHQHFSHLTAAALWGLPAPRSSLLHTTTVGDGSVTRRRQVVGHRVTPRLADIDVVHGLPVSSRLACWAECSTILPLDDLVVLGDALIVLRGRDSAGFSLPGFHTVDDLERAVRRRAGSRGARRLRSALALVRVGAESPRETRLRLQLAREGIRTPMLNCEIHDASGAFVARPDMVFGRERVCVEYDGDHHRTDRSTYRDDKRRREALADDDWHTLYVSDDDLGGELWVAFVRRLRRALLRGEIQRQRRAAGDRGPG